MLKNLTPIKQYVLDRKDRAKELNIPYTPQSEMSIEEGVYVCNFSFNFSSDEFEEFEGKDNFETSFRLYHPNYEKSQYGVSDTVDQIKEYFKEEVEDPNNTYCIHITPVHQDPNNKGEGGGWRWHKWGPYIGTLDPQCEYLDDEDFGSDFKQVLCFHIYKTN